MNHVDLPQRVTPVERPRVQPRDLLGELTLVTGAGSASSRMWNSASNSGSSTQYG